MDGSVIAVRGVIFPIFVRRCGVLWVFTLVCCTLKRIGLHYIVRGLFEAYVSVPLLACVLLRRLYIRLCDNLAYIVRWTPSSCCIV